MEPAYLAGILVVVVVIIAGRLAMNRLFDRAHARAHRQRARREVRRDVASHHQSRFLVGPHAVATHPAGWQLAASSWYALAAGEPLDTFGYTDTRHSLAILAEAWAVRSREDLHRQLLSLLVSGHRTDFGAERAQWLAMPPADQRALASGLHRDAKHSGTAAQTELRLHRVLKDVRGARTVDLTAWDLVRTIMLARAGVGAGYLSEAEAIDTGWIAAAGLRASYRDWADLHDHFARGRWYWEGVDGAGEAASDEQARQFLAVLNGPAGPLSVVPWDAPLRQSSFGFVGDLGSAGLLPHLPPTPARPWQSGLWGAVRSAGVGGHHRPQGP
ncbi:DUF1266 domain-containing protein [Occultella glacieicola]|uniref:DUF1266 domain-containing protein n=1 Tax=Occultella glacieicola TaxID=2518684 RepID=A0ABY2E9V0_9MICO|nr:DUF1266 domain-containing protein [Occultella glacieicola]TDE98844.1 DUF1266 domain-containing protein [Occultella glacieicola]